MSILDAVIDAVVMEPPRICVYGKPGIGKTTLADSAGKSIFICTESDSTKGLLGSKRLPMCNTFDDLIKQINGLGELDELGFDTIVIDGMSGIEKLIYKVICDRENEQTVQEIGGGYGKGERMSVPFFLDLFDLLDRVKNKHRVPIMILAHHNISNFKDPTSDSYNYYCPDMNKYAAAELVKWLDCLFFADYEIYKEVKKEGFNQERTVASGEGQRVLTTQERPAFLCKTRYYHPFKIPMTWDAIKKGFSK